MDIYFQCFPPEIVRDAVLYKNNISITDRLAKHNHRSFPQTANNKTGKWLVSNVGYSTRQW